MSENQELIYIGIPTFKRPIGLENLLKSISNLQIDKPFKVLVADNDSANKEGVNLVKRLINVFPFSIDYIVVSEQGISNVRNALMDKAFNDYNADYIAMVDDDVTVDSSWLSELLRIIKLTGADVVGGAVYPDFEIEPPVWTSNNNLYWRTTYPEGAVPIIQGTTSVLISRNIWDEFGISYFDPKFGLSGGGDKEFFNRLKSSGASFAFAPKAISYELFGKTRVTEKWALERAFRIGSADARIILQRQSKLRVALKAFTIYILLKLRVSFFYSDMRLRQKLYRQKGKINALFGTPPEVYKNTHGS